MDRNRIIDALDLLEDNKETLKINARRNHYLDYNQIMCQYDTLRTTLRWILELEKTNPILERLIDIAEEQE